MTSAQPASRDIGIVFEPLQLKGVRLRNRIVRAAHATGLSRGLVTDELVDYHVARARGGVALSFAEAGEVHWSSPGFLDLSSDDVLDGLNRLARESQAAGMALFQQLMHGGPTNAPHDGSAPWAASPVVDPLLNVQPRAMTKGMIDELVGAFAAAAGRVKTAGLDGVEVHGGHGYVFSTFLNPAQNRRTDEYGGDLDGRMRFLVEVLAAIRAEVGPDFVSGVRLSPDGPEDFTTIADLQQVVKRLEADGLIDYVNVSWGSHYTRAKLIGTTREPRGYQLPVTTQVAAGSTLPVMVTGRVLSLAQAADILRSGQAAMVSMVRALIADPDLITKTRAGAAASVRPCISCNQACAGGLSRGRIGCVVNVGAARERTMGDAVLRPTAAPKHLVVIGGGPAGLEAARVAGRTGHRVTLLEAGDELGGQLRLVRQSVSRSDVAELVPYYRHELERHGVQVEFGRRIAAPEEIAHLEADWIVLATGAQPRRDGFQAWRPAAPPAGIEQVTVLTGWDVLQGAAIRGPVLLVDEIGHYESIDVAEYLAHAGHVVHHVTRFHAFGAQIPLSYDYAAAAHLEALSAFEHHFHPRSVVLAVGPDSATIAPLEAQHRVAHLDVGTIVFMSGALPDYRLVESFEQLSNVTIVGDAVAPRTLEPAIVEGALAPAALEGQLERRRWVRWTTGNAV